VNLWGQLEANASSSCMFYRTPDIRRYSENILLRPPPFMVRLNREQGNLGPWLQRQATLKVQEENVLRVGGQNSRYQRLRAEAKLG